MEETWQSAWQPVIDQVGDDLGLWAWQGADVIDDGMIRRYCEVLELDCPLHHDPEVARAHGHAALPAPVTAALPFSLPPIWSPGDVPAFADGSRDGQPTHSDIVSIDVPGAPPTTGFFVTDVEMEFGRPAEAGERLHQTGLTLLSCKPKQTAVGRGAFMTFQTELRAEPGNDLIATYRVTTFSYDPVPR